MSRQWAIRGLATWLTLIVLTTGCEYGEKLKDLQLIYAASLDRNDRNEIVTTIALQSPGSEERTTPVHEVLSDAGPTVEYSMFKKVGIQVAGPIATSKNQVFLIGEQLAREDLSVVLDTLFRNSNDPLVAKVAVVQGKASDLIRLERIGSATAGEYLRKILVSARYETAIPEVTLHSLLPIFHDPGMDSVLPFIQKQGDRAAIKGIALMNNRRYTGVFLNDTQAPVFLLLAAKKGPLCILTRKLSEETEAEGEMTGRESYISINVDKMKRTKQVRVDQTGRVHIKLRLDLKANVLEYPEGGLNDKARKEQLGKQLSALLQQEAVQVASILQQSNSDALGIGRDVMAYYPKAWEAMNWKEDYRKVKFDIQVRMKLGTHGIMN
ncbi:Ger(x)C family spore germination C-terminal domain-containing protein [Paenibacillus sp. GCM10023252]|uniref:Ger(x)C family spore germination protein n=1 Tax=Paenibacillus sp. GCM10023252 TaxID=3252649 RepID=UPI00360FAE21